MRPQPPVKFLELSDLTIGGTRLEPAPEVWDWLQTEILSEDGSIHNPDHAHLIDADIQVMWVSSSFNKQGRTILGQAEQVMFRAGALFKQISQVEGVDPRLLALAKTNLQQGFMWFVRSIAKPADPFS